MNKDSFAVNIFEWDGDLIYSGSFSHWYLERTGRSEMLILDPGEKGNLDLSCLNTDVLVSMEMQDLPTDRDSVTFQGEWMNEVSLGRGRIEGYVSLITLDKGIHKSLYGPIAEEISQVAKV